MPTASEAAGRKNASRYNCGESRDTSAWTTHGLGRKAQPPNPVHNSYLERFQELKQRKKTKTDLLQETHDSTDPGKDDNYGTKQEVPQTTDSRGSQASGKPDRRDSRLCVIL